MAVAALVVNDNRGRIKGSYVGKEAFNAYFGYPQSTPPSYRKAKAKSRLKKAARKSGRAKSSATRNRVKKSVKKPVSSSPGLTAPKRNTPLG